MDTVIITVTDTQLDDIALCGHLMVEYVNPNESLLIASINQGNIQIRLELNKSCI